MSRLTGSAGLAALLTLVVVGTTAAQTGITGNYIFIDSEEKPGVVCRYDRISPSNARIYRMRVEAPQLWWPDRSSDSNTEHGTVGWRAIVQYYDVDWTTYKKTTIQKATAYEGYPGGYDLADKAPLTAKVINITASDIPVGSPLRVVVRAIWYRANGTQLGSVSHTVNWYLLKMSASDPGITNGNDCPRNINFV